MKTYIAHIIPQIQKFSQKLDNLTLLSNQHWVVLNEADNSKLIYIFRNNSELLIVNNGHVEKGRWEFIGNKSILIDNKEGSYLFKHGFFDENVLALKVDGKDEYAIFVNENKHDGNIDSLSDVLYFLNSKYLKGSIDEELRKSIPSQLKEFDVTNEKDKPKEEEEDSALAYTIIFVGLFIAVMAIFWALFH